jgi:hypothetical protein
MTHIRQRATAAYHCLLPLDRKDEQEEIDQLYEGAASMLHLRELCLWLEVQPARRVVSLPRESLGCLLATFLAEKTHQAWAVMQGDFYLLELGPEFRWNLPTWAVSLERVEMLWAQPLTAADGLALVAFIAAHLVPTERQVAAWVSRREAA